MGMVVSFTIIPIFLIAIALPIFIGVYVYRDANKRGMNGILWMLVAILAPTFIGLIIYLLVRSNHSDMNCPACGIRVTETFMVCPNCGTKLRPTCPSCAAPVQPEWKVCPHCAEPLPATYTGVTSPERPKDKTLSKILIAVLLVPVLLVILIIALLTGRLAYSGNSGYEGYSTTSMPFLEFEKEFISDDVVNWLEECKTLTTDDNECNILRYTSEANGYACVEYLIYVPGACRLSDITLDAERNSFLITIWPQGFFDFGSWKTIENMKDSLTSSITNQPYIYHVVYDSSEMPSKNIQILFRGNDMECNVTDTLLPFYSEEQKEFYYEEMQ